MITKLQNNYMNSTILGLRRNTSWSNARSNFFQLLVYPRSIHAPLHNSYHTVSAFPIHSELPCSLLVSNLKYCSQHYVSKLELYSSDLVIVIFCNLTLVISHPNQSLLLFSSNRSKLKVEASTFWLSFLALSVEEIILVGMTTSPLYTKE